MKEKLTNIILICLIIIFCISITPITMQNDTYYTIAIGEQIIENGIDMKDPFSFHKDLPYTYPHWGYDTATYLVYSAGEKIAGETGGFAAIYVATGILSVVLGITLYYTNKKLAGNKLISFVITLISIYMLRDYIAARAQLVTFILFVLEIYFIEQFLKENRKIYALGLLLIPLIVANLHAAVWWFYFILYIPYIAAWLIAKIEKKEEKTIFDKIEIIRNNNTKSLIIIMIICLLTGLFTPIENTPYTYLIKTMAGNTTQSINEHLPMTIIGHVDILVYLGTLLTILIFGKIKIKLEDLFMFVGLTLLMLISRRQLSIFVLVIGIIGNKLLAQILDNYKKDGTKMLEGILFGKRGMTFFSIIVISLSIYFIAEKKNDKFIDWTEYPVQASEWITNHLDLNKTRLFNEYNYGSYLLYKGIPVFIDSRADLYAPEFNTKTKSAEDGRDIFTDFVNASQINTFYGDIFNKYDITHFILKKNSKMNLVITNTNNGIYSELYQDDYFVIYEIKK